MLRRPLLLKQRFPFAWAEGFGESHRGSAFLGCSNQSFPYGTSDAFKRSSRLDSIARFAARRSIRTSLRCQCTSQQVAAKPTSEKDDTKVPDEKLRAFRDLLAKAGVDAYIIPSEDPHQSEYSAECFNRRAYISGFTGSAGTAVITKEKAALWTDGRYFLQAEKQLGWEWTLMRSAQPGVPTIEDWLAETLPPKSKVAIDPFLHSAENARSLGEALQAKDVYLMPLSEENLVDQVWGDERPAPPQAPLRVHPLKYAGKDVGSKLADVRKQLAEAGARILVVTMLDEVAWLLNIRGGDVPHCPVAIAYAVVDDKGARLYVEPEKVTAEVAEHFDSENVTVRPYTALLGDLTEYAAAGAVAMMDPDRVSAAVFKSYQDAVDKFYERRKKGDGKKKKAKKGSGGGESGGPAIISRSSPITAAKAIKNEGELEGMRQAHLRDAAALANFWAWLENLIVTENKSISEVEIADRLEGFRKQQSGFLDTSFDTIAGAGPNGAVIHYRAEEGTCRTLDRSQLFLLDSGAQYVDGTTDVTRTVHFGEPSSRQREAVTRVLQGHIALDQAVFPEKTPGFVLDVLARRALWSDGLDYRHGTGHGVGAALNVHEGPQGISARFGNMTGLQAGMVVSNEPGYYEDGAFGIRIENLLAIKEVSTPNRFGGSTFLGFERLTFVPIQTSLLELSLMSDNEIEWLNDYHHQVWEKVSPLVSGDARAWLKRWTRPISKIKSPFPGAQANPAEKVPAAV